MPPRRTRPRPEVEDPRIIIPMPTKLIKQIDEFRWANRIPSRSETIRQLIKAGLQIKPQNKLGKD